MAYKIEGMDDCLRCLDAAPGNVVKMAKTAMREGGKQTARLIRQRTPARWRKLAGYKISKGQLSGDSYALVGYFNKGGKKEERGQIPDWFKAYWQNYGTLTKRDPSHHFENAVKGKVRGRRNSVGQAAQNFFEGAIGGWEDKFMEAFEKKMAEQEDKLYDR